MLQMTPKTRARLARLRQKTKLNAGLIAAIVASALVWAAIAALIVLARR